MTSLSSQFLLFIDRMRAATDLAHRVDAETPTLEVDEAVRRIAGLYEKTRNTLEYGEQDFLRNRAIQRSLRRLLNFGVTEGDSSERAGNLLRELIRAGYFPNNEIPEEALIPVAQTVDRFFVATEHVNTLFHDELVRFAAFEIEDAIFPERAAAQLATVAFVIETAEGRLKWPQRAKNDKGHRAFLFIAAHRAVLNADSARILYAFLRDAVPGWRFASPEDVVGLAKDFERALAAAKRTIAHPNTEHYTRALRRWAPALHAIDEVVSQKEFLEQQALPDDSIDMFQFERRIEEAVEGRFKTVRRKLRVAAFRATLYVFFTKMIIGLGVELPYEYLRFGVTVTDPFLINLFFPPALMFLVAFAARPPGPAVAQRIVEDAMRIASSDDMLGHVRLPRQRGAIRSAFFVLTTMLLGGAALYFLLRALKTLEFHVLSMAIFLLFLCVVSLFAWRIRKPLRDIAATSRQGVFSTLIEVLIFPFLAVGRVLSDGIRTVNVFVFLLDVFIESPIKMMFAVFEDWIAFLREKRERITED